MTDETQMILTELKSLSSDVSVMKSDVNSMKRDVSSLKNDVNSLKSDVSSQKRDVSSLKSNMDALKRDVSEVQLTLENETNKKIAIIAEGHLDLNRKLDEALKGEIEKEMLLIRVTSLENDMRRMKNRAR